MLTKFNYNGARSHRIHDKLVGLCDSGSTVLKFVEMINFISLASDHRTEYTNVMDLPLLFVRYRIPLRLGPQAPKLCKPFREAKPLSAHFASFPNVKTGIQVYVSKEFGHFRLYIHVQRYLCFELRTCSFANPSFLVPMLS